MRFVFAALLALLVATGCNRVSPTIDIEPGSVPFPRNGDGLSLQRDPGVFPITNPRPHQVLQEGDVVHLSLWGEDIISGDYTIGPDGYITVPLIGDIPSTNTLRSELLVTVKERLEDYYDDPLVEVSVSEYTPRHAFLLGGVNTPGSIELSANESLLTALSKAGGIRERRNERGQSLGMPGSIRILREGVHMAVIDSTALLAGTDPLSNVAIVPGDVIYIPENDTQTVSVLGQVKVPGLVGLSPGMDVTEAVALSGGFTEDAVREQVRILRNWWSTEPQLIVYNYKKTEKNKGEGPVVLQDQDIVFVPTKTLAMFNYTLRQITPTFTYFGSAAAGP
jgi:polysaccharide export outer membrane protein